MFIFAVSMGLLSFHALHSLELSAIDFSLSRRFYEDPAPQGMKETDPPVMIVPLYDQIPQDLFLESMKDVARHLKEAGAKIIVIPLPDRVRPNPRNLQVIHELALDSAIIFGVPAAMNTRMYFSNPAIEDRQTWWVQHPLYHRSNIHWGAITEVTGNFSRLTRFVPTGIRDDNTGDPVPEVIVLALKRYFDIPDNAELPLTPRRLYIGSFGFPIEHDGLTYVHNTTMNQRFVGMYVSLNPVNNSIMYFPATARSVTDTAAIRAAWQAYRGKIVFIDWYGNAGAYRYPSRGWVYTQIANSFINRSFVSVHNEWNALLITTLVILLSVISYTARNSFMVFLSIALSAGAVAISAWLFKSHNVIFEPVYVIVPILLCGFILPIAKTAGEKRMAEERAANLEAENRRLRDIQQSTSPGTHF